MRTPLSYKRGVADKMLVYLKEQNIVTCADTYKMLSQISEVINEPLHILWKAYELLRPMARLELNSLNGRKGFRVLSYDPLASALPDRPSVLICEAQRCPILKAIRRKFPELSIVRVINSREVTECERARGVKRVGGGLEG